MDDDMVMQSESFAFDPYLTVLGLLKTHYGLEHGREIYDLLFRTALAAADDLDPAILFDASGGEFVGIEQVE